MYEIQDSTETRENLNEFGLDKAMWKRWGKDAQDLFCAVYEEMTAIGWKSLSHPESPALTDEQFKTIAHNAAFTAADILARKK